MSREVCASVLTPELGVGSDEMRTPVERARVWLYSAPAYAAGYVDGETMRLVAEFERRVSVVGLPRMAIKIGEAIRLAGFSPWVEDDWPPERPSFRQR